MMHQGSHNFNSCSRSFPIVEAGLGYPRLEPLALARVSDSTNQDSRRDAAIIIQLPSYGESSKTAAEKGRIYRHYPSHTLTYQT